MTGYRKENRTGVDTLALFDRQIKHDMSLGMPLLSTKRVAWKTAKVELEGFINGVTSKKWYQDRGCHIWDEWCNPQKVPYGTDAETQAKMLAEDDLGPCLYGASWRGFHDPRSPDFTNMLVPNKDATALEKLGNPRGVDQLQYIVDTLKTNPDDRRMLCLAWNPMGLEHTALPACHIGWIVNVLNGKLNLKWWQRSADWFLGVPFNATFYGLLLHLLAKEVGLEVGELVGDFTDVHLYTNHIDQAEEQITREPSKFEYPEIITDGFDGIFNWTHEDSKLVGYNPQPAIKAPVAV